ncbi:prephenate dehydrogenase [Streptomyces sp. NPDC051776]|uniref:prephenate dehydrogenase n=1 Tax=Streptomyces sp. NPDC051776 TaxID=3155414 RepID=UPI003438D013
MSDSPRTAPVKAVPGRIRRCVLAGGSGAVGGLFAGLLAGAGIDVCLVDPAPPAVGPAGVRHLPGDITAPGEALRAELAETDLLLLAVPEEVALDAVRATPGRLRPGALLADTLSVKSRVVSEVAAHAAGREAVGLNPMFAPSLGLDGRPVAAVVLHDGPLVAELLALVARSGGRVVRVGAERHDRLAAASQALTHATVLAFGHALTEIDVDIEELAVLAPPPHTALLSLLARIASGTPEVYWDIQSANPYAADAREALARGAARLQDLVREGDEKTFAHFMHELSGGLGGRSPHYRDLCAELFTRIPAAGPKDAS